MLPKIAENYGNQPFILSYYWERDSSLALHLPETAVQSAYISKMVTAPEKMSNDKLKEKG